MESKKRYVIIDIEADGLKPTKIWVVVTKDVETGEVRTWFSRNDLRDYIRGCWLVGHNILWFDVPVLNVLWQLGISPEQCIDTLVFSRLLNSWDYSRHSLGEWGERLGFPKQEWTDWSQLSDGMVEYCKNDVELTYRIFQFQRKFMEDERFKWANEIEHRAAIICTEMHFNGFGFDVEAAKSLYSQIENELSSLSEQIKTAFPSRKVLNRTILPRPTKSGQISRTDFRWLEKDVTPESIGAVIGVPYHIFDTVEFNPASPKQCIERLNEFGWKPIEKTKGHLKTERDLKWARGKERQELLAKLEDYKINGWTISDENLSTLPEDAPPAAKLLVRHILLTRRLTTLQEWIDAYNPETKCIHGTINSIGTWTHRASHKNPNTGNIASLESAFGPEMRSQWNSTDGYRQVGCDAEGIQLRILAHYMDDTSFTTALVAGRSEDGTDVHTLNWKKLNGDGDTICPHRKAAKTFIYSFILGAGEGKTAQIFSCSLEQSKRARNNFISAFPGLARIKRELIPADASRGWFEGLDGRPVMCDSEHLMLAGYLQNGETVVMKLANWKWRTQLKKEKIPFFQMNYVHDEWQTRVLDGLPDDVYHYVGQTQADSIKWAGEELGLKCPLAGKYIIGYNWKDCH